MSYNARLGVLCAAMGTTLGLASAVRAADLPLRTQPSVSVVAPAFTWTGFYLGVNVGYAADASSRRNGFVDSPINPVSFPLGNTVPAATFVPVVPVRTVTFDERSRDGFSGGGQIGYNYQFGVGSGFVLGVETDIQYLSFGGTRAANVTLSAPGGLAPTFKPINGDLSALEFFGTARGRLGYALDRVLVYGTGGLAYASGNSYNFNGFTNTVANFVDFRMGWVAGGGLEYALPADSILNFFPRKTATLKIEGIYVSLERQKSNLSLVGATTQFGGILPVFDTLNFSHRNSSDFVVFRAGLNYKFGGL